MARRQRTLAREQLAEMPQDSNNPMTVPWLVLAFIIMPISARTVIDDASVLARCFSVGDLIVGPGGAGRIETSLPELATFVAEPAQGRK